MTGASAEGRTVTAPGDPLPTTTQEGIPVREEASTAPSFFSFAGSTPASRLARGSLAVSAAVPVQLFERGQLVGNSWSGGVRLSIGRHELQAVNRALGIDTLKTVDIARDTVASLVVERTPGIVTINVAPGASVRIDGAAAGRTPIANLEVISGPHEVVFTRPGFPERRMMIAVTSGMPLTVSALPLK